METGTSLVTAEKKIIQYNKKCQKMVFKREEQTDKDMKKPERNKNKN